MKNSDLNKKLGMGTKIGYAFGGFGENIAYNFYYLFFIFFLTDVAGIKPAIAGTISLFAVAWDAITDPLVGYISDRSKNPKGKRRPLIMKFCIPLGIAVTMLFADFHLTGWTQAFYFLAANIVFWVVFTLVDIPYMVLGGEISRIEEDRLSIKWMYNAFNYVSYAIAGYALIIVSKFETLTGSVSSAWTATAAVFGVVITITFLIVVLVTKGKEPMHAPTEAEENVKFFQSIWVALKIKPYTYLLLYVLFFMTGIMLFTSNQVYLFVHNLNASEAQISNLYLAYAIMVIIFSPLIAKIAAKMGNKKTLIMTVALTTVGFGVFKFFPMNMVTIWGLLIACGIGAVGYFVISGAMIYDIADVAELKTGINNEGMLISFNSFGLKFATALSLWILGLILDFYQYDAAGPMTEFTLTGIKNAGTIIPAILCGISIIFLVKYSLSKEVMEKLRVMRKDKEDGKEVDMEFVRRVM